MFVPCFFPQNMWEGGLCGASSQVVNPVSSRPSSRPWIMGGIISGNMLTATRLTAPIMDSANFSCLKPLINKKGALVFFYLLRYLEMKRQCLVLSKYTQRNTTAGVNARGESETQPQKNSSEVQQRRF